MAYVVFDIGGTTTSVGVAEDLEVIQASRRFPTASNPKQGIQDIVAAVKELLGSKVEVQGAVGGIRGQLDEEHSMVVKDAILTGWVNFAIKEELVKEWGCSVWLENDTALAGLGEAVHGAGQGFDIVVYHSISTGVGGVKVEHGRLDEATIGFEPGHQNIDIDRTVLGDEIEPTLENLVSGRAVESRMGEPAYNIPQSDTIWDMLANYLAQGLRNSILYWSPEVIVLGGSMVLGKPNIPIEAIRNHTVQSLDGFTQCPFITLAKYGDDSGLYGALVYLGQKEVEQQIN